MKLRICFLYTSMWLTLERWASTIEHHHSVSHLPLIKQLSLHQQWLGHYLNMNSLTSLLSHPNNDSSLRAVPFRKNTETEQVANTWRPREKADSVLWVPYQASEGQKMMTSSGKLSGQQANEIRQARPVKRKKCPFRPALGYLKVRGSMLITEPVLKRITSLWMD